MVVAPARGHGPTAPKTGHPTYKVTLNIAGAGVAVRGSGAVARALLESRFSGFVSASSDERLAIGVIDDGGGFQLTGGDGARGGPTRIEGDGYLASIDLGAGAAAVTGPAVADGVEAVMRFALPHVLFDGLLVHGATLRDAARGFLCVGPSGAGKSTLARLLPDRALGDELAVVRSTPAGWVVGSFPTPSARSDSVPLARLFFLRHAVSHERRKLSPARAAKRLAEQCHWPTEDPESGRRSFELVTRLAEDVPAFDLGFAVDRGVWDAITAVE